jgi:hypothetical protein
MLKPARVPLNAINNFIKYPFSGIMTIKRQCIMKKKQLIWMGSSYKDLVSFPPEVVHAIGYALFRAELGGNT